MNCFVKISMVLFICIFTNAAYGQYVIQPTKGYSPQIGIMVGMLEELKQRISEDVRHLNQEETDFLFDEKANSIGALIMHLAATEAYYQVETLEDRRWTDEESDKWEIASNMGPEARKEFKGKSIQHYLDLWRKVREKTLAGLKAKDDDWFASTIEEGINNYWVWFHVMEHQANHMGQIALIKSRLPRVMSGNNENMDYTFYHRQVLDAETMIAAKNYGAALQGLEDLFGKYEFVFFRDYQMATQLALLLNKKEKAARYLALGIKAGWTIPSIRKNRFLKKFRKTEDWKSIKKEYPALHDKYMASLDQQLRKIVHEMFKEDQKKAFRAFLRISSKAQDRYAENKFAPHSEQQLHKLLQLLLEKGYPGEKRIGNEVWMSTILSHHNSISTNYNTRDTLYQSLKPNLAHALKNGDISAFSFVLMEEWYRASIKDKTLPTFGILDDPLQKDLEETNKRRASVYLRPIEVHNKLVDIQKETGMDLYLDGNPWQKGKIIIR